MKLIKAHATNYRNIVDSNQVDIAQATCLVGKNEAGKTAFLKALEGLNSTNESFKQYNKIENYPRRHLADYNQRHADGPAKVITTTWQMDAADISAVEMVLGKGVLVGNTFEVSKTYDQANSNWVLNVKEEVVLQNLYKRFPLNPEEAAALSAAKSTGKVAEALTGLTARSPAQENLLGAIAKFRKHSSLLCAIDILAARMPKFMYFSHYDRMSGELSINQLNADKQANSLQSGDRVFLDFLEYAGTTLDDLVATKQFEDRNRVFQ